MKGIPVRAGWSHGAVASWRRTRRVVVLCAVIVGLGWSAACSRADAPVPEDDGAASQAQGSAGPVSRAEPAASMPAAESPAARPSQTPPPLSSPEHRRYQRLRLETLRAMIEAAKLALPIGPFQERIDAAARIALDDVTEAADRMEGIVADLQEAIAAAGR